MTWASRGVASAAIVFAVITTGTDALAKKPPPPPSLPPVVSICSPEDVSPDAVNCKGWYKGNLLNNANLGVDALALNALLGTSTYTASNDAPIAELSNLKDGPGGLTTIDFGQTLYGDTVIAFHNGAAKGVKGDTSTGEEPGLGAEGTAFFLFDLQTAVQSITLNVPGSSSASLFSTEEAPTGRVPEPATWASLLFGIGVLGGWLRVRRKSLQAV